MFRSIFKQPILPRNIITKVIARNDMCLFSHHFSYDKLPFFGVNDPKPDVIQTKLSL
jgi:hypothetical protein